MEPIEQAGEQSERSLGELQTLGMIAQAITMLLSIAQSMVVIRLLSVGEFGLVGLALGAGGVLDVLQQFTIQSAAVRELARNRDKAYAQQVIVTAVVVRIVMILPNSLIILASASQIAEGIYRQPGLRLPIQLLAMTTIVTSIRAILENTLTALHAFRTYYVYLICAFILRLALFWPLVALWRVNGYFVAEITWTCLLAVALLAIVRHHVGPWQGMPSWNAMRSIGKAILGLSLVLFAGRLSYAWWKRGATALLGLFTSGQEVGLFHFGISFAVQILAISGALSRVYLPLMSRLARDDPETFRLAFPANFCQVVTVFWLGVGLVILFAREITLILAGQQYLGALPLLPPLVLAFFVQALFSMLNTGVLVPTDNDRWFLAAVVAGRAISMLLFVGALIQFADMHVSAWGMFLGLVVGLITMLWAVTKRAGIDLLRCDFLPLVVMMLPWIWASLADTPLLARVGLSIAVTPAYVWWATRRGLFDMGRVAHYLSRLRHTCFDNGA